MKKLFFSIVVILFTTFNSYSQQGEKSVGINVVYGTEIKNVGVGARFNYGITDEIRLAPNFNYFIKKDGLSGLEFNADAHYLFEVAPEFKIYPLAGLTCTSWRFSWGDAFKGLEEYGIEVDKTSSTTTKFGINLGGGLVYSLSDNIDLGVEAKYSLVSDFDQMVFGINLCYKF